MQYNFRLFIFLVGWSCFGTLPLYHYKIQKLLTPPFIYVCYCDLNMHISMDIIYFKEHQNIIISASLLWNLYHKTTVHNYHPFDAPKHSTIPSSDPIRLVVETIYDLARHVTSDANFQRFYGSNWNTKFFEGAVLELFSYKNLGDI